MERSTTKMRCPISIANCSNIILTNYKTHFIVTENYHLQRWTSADRTKTMSLRISCNRFRQNEYNYACFPFSAKYPPFSRNNYAYLHDWNWRKSSKQEQVRSKSKITSNRHYINTSLIVQRKGIKWKLGVNSSSEKLDTQSCITPIFEISSTSNLKAKRTQSGNQTPQYR